jgi:hypothetical protein
LRPSGAVDASCHPRYDDDGRRISASQFNPARGRFLILLLMPAHERAARAKVPASFGKIKIEIVGPGNIVRLLPAPKPFRNGSASQPRGDPLT